MLTKKFNFSLVSGYVEPCMHIFQLAKIVCMQFVTELNFFTFLFFFVLVQLVAIKKIKWVLVWLNSELTCFEMKSMLGNDTAGIFCNSLQALFHYAGSDFKFSLCTPLLVMQIFTAIFHCICIIHIWSKIQVDEINKKGSRWLSSGMLHHGSGSGSGQHFRGTYCLHHRLVIKPHTKQFR
jgi:hypothetical protein